MSSNMKKMAPMGPTGGPKSPIQGMPAGMAPKMPAMKKGGKVAKFARGGGIEQRGKTKGKFC